MFWTLEMVGVWSWSWSYLNPKILLQKINNTIIYFNFITKLNMVTSSPGKAVLAEVNCSFIKVKKPKVMLIRCKLFYVYILTPCKKILFSGWQVQE